MSAPAVKIFDLASEALQAGELCILCSVVRLEGSGYGRVGARLLVTESGDREGYISGGCLEKDLCRRALQEAHTHPKLMTFDTRGNSITHSRYNTGCEGVVYVLCQPLSLDSCILRVASTVRQQRRAARLLTVYRSQRNGLPIGTTLGEFEDGTLITSDVMPDAAVVRSLQRLLRDQPGSFTATINDTTSDDVTSGDITNNNAMQPELELVVQALQPPPRLVIFGAGDDVKPVVQVATGLGWEVCVVGKRPEAANSRRFPSAQVFCGDYAELASTLVADEYTHVISMSHDFESDLQILPGLMSTSLRSIGLLGSKRRLARLLAELYYRGERLSTQQINRIRSPLGLDIGAESPEEIALSIVSELAAIERSASGTRLSATNTSTRSRLPHYTLSTLDGFSSRGAQPCLMCDDTFQVTPSVEGR